jgi:hypothetical protein
LDVRHIQRAADFVEAVGDAVLRQFVLDPDPGNRKQVTMAFSYS